MNQYEPAGGAAKDGKECGCHALKNAAALAGGVVLAAAAANALIALRTRSHRHALGGVFGRYPYRHGALAFTVAGSGPPLLLLHNLFAGNSMNEWSENFAQLQRSHTVYALDFPGWGLSDKPDRVLGAEDYIEPIQFFIEDIVGLPCTVIASGDACSFAVEAAARRPDLVAGLVLVCPSTHDADAAIEKTAPLVQHLFQLPVAGRTVYNLMVSQAALRAFAERHLYFDKTRVTPALVERYYAAAHSPGAERGYAAAASGALNTDVREAWSSLVQPALLVWGRNALLNPVDAAPEWLALKNDAVLEVLDHSMMLPHAERAGAFNALVENWLAQHT